MPKPAIITCVQKDIVPVVNWSLKDFEGTASVKHFDKIDAVPDALDRNPESLLFLDSVVSGEATLDFARELRTNKPSVKIVLIASSDTRKEDIVELIKAKTVNGILLRPFSAAQISDYVYKLCGFQNPSENPWYAKKD
jgi:two-component SAPR family response regulator